MINKRKIRAFQWSNNERKRRCNYWVMVVVIPSHAVAGMTKHYHIWISRATHHQSINLSVNITLSTHEIHSTKYASHCPLYASHSMVKKFDVSDVLHLWRGDQQSTIIDWSMINGHGLISTWSWLIWHLLTHDNHLKGSRLHWPLFTPLDLSLPSSIVSGRGLLPIFNSLRICLIWHLFHPYADIEHMGESSNVEPDCLECLTKFTYFMWSTVNLEEKIEVCCIQKNRLGLQPWTLFLFMVTKFCVCKATCRVCATAQ